LGHNIHADNAAGNAAQEGDGWDAWPVDNAVPNLNENVAPVLQQELDLNAPADPEEMVIDPVFPGPLQQEMFIEMNDLLNQVNEEEDILVNLDDLHSIENELDNMINDPQNVDVVLPHLNNPVDAMHHEIQENELMNDEEIQQQIAEEAAQEDQARLQNIQVGRVIIQDAPLP